MSFGDGDPDPLNSSKDASAHYKPPLLPWNEATATTYFLSFLLSLPFTIHSPHYYHLSHSLHQEGWGGDGEGCRGIYFTIPIYAMYVCIATSDPSIAARQREEGGGG
jgi:hypothetical protein